MRADQTHAELLVQHELEELRAELEMMEELEAMKIEMRVLELVQRPPPPKSPIPRPLLQAADAKRIIFPTVKGGAFSTARRLDVAESQNVGGGANVAASGAKSSERAVDRMDWGFGTSATVPSYSFGPCRGPPPEGASVRRAHRASAACAAVATAGIINDAAAIAEDALNDGYSSDECSACADDCCSSCECLCHEGIGASESAQEEKELRNGASADECSACADDCCSTCDCLCHEELATDTIPTDDAADDDPAVDGDGARGDGAQSGGTAKTAVTEATAKVVTEANEVAAPRLPPRAAPAPPPPGMGRVVVSLPTAPATLRVAHGNALRFLLPLGARRSALSARIAAKIGVPAAEQRVFWRGNALSALDRLQWPGMRRAGSASGNTGRSTLQLWLEVLPGLRRSIAATEASTARGPKWGAPTSKHPGVAWDAASMRWTATIEISSQVVAALTNGQQAESGDDAAAKRIGADAAARAATAEEQRLVAARAMSVARALAVATSGCVEQRSARCVAAQTTVTTFRANRSHKLFCNYLTRWSPTPPLTFDEQVHCGADPQLRGGSRRSSRNRGAAQRGGWCARGGVARTPTSAAPPRTRCAASPARARAARLLLRRGGGVFIVFTVTFYYCNEPC